MLKAYVLMTEEFCGDLSPPVDVRALVFTILDSLMANDYDLFNSVYGDDLLFMRTYSEFELMEMDYPQLFNDPRLLNILVNETVDVARQLHQRYSHIVKIEYIRRTPEIFYLFTR